MFLLQNEMFNKIEKIESIDSGKLHEIPNTAFYH